MGCTFALQRSLPGVHIMRTMPFGRIAGANSSCYCCNYYSWYYYDICYPKLLLCFSPYNSTNSEALAGSLLGESSAAATCDGDVSDSTASPFPAPVARNREKITKRSTGHCDLKFPVGLGGMEGRDDSKASQTRANEFADGRRIHDSERECDPSFSASTRSEMSWRNWTKNFFKRTPLTIKECRDLSQEPGTSSITNPRPASLGSKLIVSFCGANTQVVSTPTQLQGGEPAQIIHGTAWVRVCGRLNLKFKS